MKAIKIVSSRVALLLYCLCFAARASAGTDPVISATLEGSAGQISPDSAITVRDDKYFDPSNDGILTKPYPVSNKVSLLINESSLAMIQGAFTATVRIQITAAKAGSVQEVTDTSLAISYDPLAPYVHENAFYFEGGYDVEVKVLSVSTNAGWNVWDVLALRNELRSTPMYVFTCTSAVIDTIEHETLSADTDEDEIEVSWPARLGADEYDLEWTYIDSGSLRSGRFGDTANPDPVKIFNNNATRVTISSESYKIPLIYDSRGSLFFRVRAVHYKADRTKVESNWGTAATALGRFDYDGHERKLNWQATTSFAEDGKRKTVVQYFDGSLRSRQTVTKDNTTDTTIITESFYDYQGRPVIQVLPAPTLSSIIKYTPHFNTDINGDIYDKNNFDSLSDPTLYCSSAAQPMNGNSGAARYYSANNPLASQGIHRFIPDAGGYPFTEVQYTQDNTGRIAKQSGVGPNHRIGGDHDTRYYYGTPDQKELDALFGTEAGVNTHYQKTMVRDANGQYSVSYTDMHGRTVATALAGKPADTKLDTLASYRVDSITETLSDTSTVVIKDLVMESKKGLLVATAGDHVFSYQLNPSVLRMEGCDEQQVCYNCLYDLRITITDDCNNQHLGGQPFDTLIRNFSIGAIDTTCAGDTAGFSVTFTKFLEEGSYEITKELSVSRYGLDYYRDSVFMERNSCLSIDSFIAKQRAIVQASQDCTPSCAACEAALLSWDNYRNDFLQKAGIVPADSASYTSMILSAYEEAQHACDVLCSNSSKYDDIRSSMLADMTPPSGQYANLAASNRPWSVLYGDEDAQPKYQLPTNYADENGRPDTVYDEHTGLYLPPQRLGAEAFAQKFKPSWAEALLPYHPEYCRFQEYEKFAESAQWDRRFEAVDTYREALAKGYLNPINLAGSNYLKYKGWSGSTHPDPDPMASVSGNAFYDSLSLQLTHPRNNTVNTSGVSMWALATLTTLCPDASGQTCYTTYGSDAAAFDTTTMCEGDLDMAWRIFRQLYLNAKQKIISDDLQTACTGGTYPTTAQIVDSSYVPHFSDGEEYLAINGISMPSTVTEKDQLVQQLSSDADTHYSDNCEAYATQWLENLDNCNYDQNDKDAIVDLLVEVCKEGSDPQHPVGASSVKPSSTYQYRSFEDVIKSYNAAHDIPYDAACNAYLITAPQPYDRAIPFGVKKLWAAPDSCECSVIKTYYDAYQSHGAMYGTFSNFLGQRYHTFLADSTIDKLLSLCNPTLEASCHYLATPIELPVLFQCHAPTTCADCEAFNTQYLSFKDQFPGVYPVRQPIDSTDSVHNKVFVQFMNSQFGFTKDVWEYLDFMDSCGVDTTSGAFSYDSLNVVAKQYNVTTNPYRVRVYCQSNYFDPPFHIIDDLHQITTGGYMHWPDSIRENNTSHDWVYHQNTLPGGPKFCWQNGYSVEMRLKCVRDILSSSHDVYYYTDANLSLVIAKRVVNPGGTILGTIKLRSPVDSSLFNATSGYVVLDSDTSAFFNSWNTIKITVTQNRLRFYYNGTLYKQIDTAMAPIMNGTAFTNAFYSYQGAVDWVKVYDASGNLQYFEDFEDPDNRATINPAFVCPPPLTDCHSSFTDYFNTEKGTGYTYEQIDSIYTARGQSLNVCGPNQFDSLTNLKNEFINDYFNYGKKFDSDGSDTMTWKVDYGPVFNSTGIAHKEIFKNGVMQYPDSLYQHPPLEDIDFDFLNRDSACVEGHLSFEFRVKSPIDSAETFHSFLGQLMFENGSSYLFSFDQLNNHFNLLSATESGQSQIITDISEFQGDYSGWQVIKFEFIDSIVKFYKNGQLLKTMTFGRVMPRKLFGYTLSVRADERLGGMYDYVRMYDKDGRLFYNEEFNDPAHFALFDPYIECPKKPCMEAFTDYYNEHYQTTLNQQQITDIYDSKHIALDFCNSTAGPTLCGAAEPLFPATALEPIDNCSDSAFFIQSNAQELYATYKDSLQNSFDSNYVAKCLQAYKYESFTVTHAVSEFHYTLYYYDQAGNLVQTVPPAGVHPNRDPQWLADVAEARKTGTTLTPTHTLLTDYRYNTLNQVVAQQTPDAGQSHFWYDRLGRLVLSQNAKQKAVSATAAGRLYSYTKYDALGRITEVGQIKDADGSVAITDTLTRSKPALDSWLAARDNYRGQITTTVYDQPYTGFTELDNRLIVQQQHLRNRVSYTTYADTSGTAAFNQATYYSYDIHGNVDTLLQDYGSLADNIMNQNTNRFKKLVYQYDLISGKVNEVQYQPGWNDQVYHRYSYDAENRLTGVETSFDSLTWETEANYEYYKHGPLARTTIGQQQVQGMDYAYTLQGWLKGVNSTALTADRDMGEDGLLDGLHQFVAKDAIGFNLNYFTGDYSAINSSVNPFPGYMAYLPQAEYRPLYNGNISSMAVNNEGLNNDKTVGGPLLFYNYRYDQLNRLTGMDAYNGFDATANSWSGITLLDFFKERVAYDANGNILKYLRNGQHTDQLLMDSLEYHYYTNTNQLQRVHDAVAAESYGGQPGDVADIDDQTATNNYEYDEIGNLIKDNAESITAIKWSVYGKILEIDKTPTAGNPVTKINYSYDAQGNRISKRVERSSGKSYTWYVRDAQGNTMAVYQTSGDTTNLQDLTLKQTERHLYGSSRLGIYSQTVDVDHDNSGPADMADSNNIKYYRGYRQYELTNHLGNVLATISDKKNGFDSNSDGTIDYYTADIVTAQDYYPFGMIMPGRNGYQVTGGWGSGSGSGSSLPSDIAIDLRLGNQPPEYVASNSIELTDGFESGVNDVFLAYIDTASTGSGGSGSVEGSSLYRYGFNGKEMDSEVKGSGNQYDYGFRIYDPRTGKFLSTDPLVMNFPFFSPYQFAGNEPIKFIDLDGLEQANPLNGIQTDAPTIDPKYKNTLLRRHNVEFDPVTKFAIGIGKTIGRTFGAITQIFGATEYGDKIPKDRFAQEFPALAHDNTVKDLVLPIVTSPVELATQLKKDPTNAELWGEAAGLFILVKGGSFSGKFSSETLGFKVDLMGGEKSRYGQGWINYDVKAKSGINDGVENFKNHFGENTVQAITVDNPQASFLEYVTESIKEGGTITIRGGMSNRYFKEIFTGKAKGLSEYEVLSKNENVSNPGYKHSDGQTPVGGKINEVILRKRK